MKKLFALLSIVLTASTIAHGQSFTKIEGKCSDDIKWTFDGVTLFLTNVGTNMSYAVLPDYDTKMNIAPWLKRGLNVKRVQVGSGIIRIGSCAFYNCETLQEVVFKGTVLREIGWGAFLNCTQLRTISLPVQVQEIGTIAFANCHNLLNVNIPDRCRVGDQAYASCKSLNAVEVGMTAILGHLVFATEHKEEGKVSHTFYDGELRRLPPYITVGNCNEYGLSKESVEKYFETNSVIAAEDYDAKTSLLDAGIPSTSYSANDTYALIIGNQNYRFVGKVPYAIHDARIFSEYCQKTLGIPVGNIHLVEDATKEMILEEEFEDWLGTLKNREEKKLIVYYAGHGVPDIKNKNKAYLLPTDVRGTNPKRGISLDNFYSKLGDFAFYQTAVFLDACFSGVNRDNESISEGLRGVEIEVEDATFGNGNVVVFSASQGNETAQGYAQEGHGLFTYYLLKNLRDSHGYISFGELSDNLQKQVSEKAPQLQLRKSQTPATNSSANVAETWRTMRF